MKTPSKIEIVPDNLDAANSLETVPSFLKPFAVKNPAQLFQKYFPLEAVEAIGGFVSGIFPNFGVTVPDWVMKSSFQFWKNYGFQKNFNAYESEKDFGVLFGMIDHFVRHPHFEPKNILEKLLTKAAPKFVRFIEKSITTNLSPLQKSNFYAGLDQSTEIISKFETPNYLDMVKLAPLYLVVAVAWRKIESFDTHAAREDWLRKNKVIKENVTSREVYQAFAIIGLPGAKPGKPKQVET